MCMPNGRGLFGRKVDLRRLVKNAKEEPTISLNFLFVKKEAMIPTKGPGKFNE